MTDFFLSKEYEMLSKVINQWDVGMLMCKLHLYKDEELHVRVQHMLQDYIVQKDSCVSEDEIQIEINILNKIFPDIPIKKIHMMIKEIGNEPNRIRIIARRLLKKSRKRSVSVETNGSTETKKTKLLHYYLNGFDINEPSTSAGITHRAETNYSDANTSKIENKPEPSDSQSTINYSSQEYDHILSNSLIESKQDALDMKKEETPTQLTEEAPIVKDVQVLEIPHDTKNADVNTANIEPLELVKNKNDNISLEQSFRTNHLKPLLSKINTVDVDDENNFKQKAPFPRMSTGMPIKLRYTNAPSTSANANRKCSDGLPKMLIGDKSSCKGKHKNLINARLGRINPSFKIAITDDKYRDDVQFLNFPQTSKHVQPKLINLTRLPNGKMNVNMNQLENAIDKLPKSNDNDVIEIDPQVIIDECLVHRLLEIFPEACPQYMRRMCTGKVNTPVVIDQLISDILNEENYPRRERVKSPEQQITLEEQLDIMKQVLPDCDPNYLQIHCDRLLDKPNELKAFIAELIETRSYPTMKDYLRKQQISAQQRQYTTDFSVEKFLDVIPDPVSHFANLNNRETIMSIENHHYAVCFLRNQFPKVPIRHIREVFKKNATNLLKTCEALKQVDPKTNLKVKRASYRMPEAIQDIPLLQEIAYIEHHAEILTYLKNRDLFEKEEREYAKSNGLLKCCSCCYDDEVMFKDIFQCEKGCMFCKSCVQKSVEVAFGDGKLNFGCLSDCDSQFNLQVLQVVLPPKMFSIIALKKQVEEVKAAGIEDLETCPFCDFASIPPKEDKLFRCLNPECMKESCRQCKEPSHVPLRCEEVEKENDVKIRTYIENKMTEALLRKCYKCGLKFIKSEGCNKMTCSCGAIMCYVCGAAVKDYKHFNGPGGDQNQLCPLYSDTNLLHEQAVLKGAQIAKEEVGVAGDPTKLKIDPTIDIKQHYKQASRRHPPLPGIAVGNVFVPQDRGQLNLYNVRRRLLHIRPNMEQEDVDDHGFLDHLLNFDGDDDELFLAQQDRFPLHLRVNEELYRRGLHRNRRHHRHHHHHHPH